MSSKSNLINQSTLGQRAWGLAAATALGPCLTLATVPSSGDQGRCAGGLEEEEEAGKGKGASKRLMSDTGGSGTDCYAVEGTGGARPGECL